MHVDATFSICPTLSFPNCVHKSVPKPVSLSLLRKKVHQCGEDSEDRSCLRSVSHGAWHTVDGGKGADRCQLLLQPQDMGLQPAGERQLKHTLAGFALLPFQSGVCPGPPGLESRSMSLVPSVSPGCLGSSQSEVAMTQLTWSWPWPGKARYRAWLFGRKWNWAWGTHPHLWGPETALTSLFCSL